MVKVNRLFEVLRVEVGVNLCGDDTFVTQHILHGFKIRPAFYEVRCKGMAEGVGTDIF